ncbi:MAG: M23 family metallopeptidase [Rikenellaceae bacterium]|nr:M23 family metallopeptidase [Rikenellaceae bacterium]
MSRIKGEYDHKKRRRLLRLTLNLFVWIGVAVVYYVLFSIFFDTPIEHEIRKSNREMTREYDRLSRSYDSLMTVLDNVVARDENIYGMLFESAPYTSLREEEEQWRDADKLLSMSNNELAGIYFDGLRSLESTVTKVTNNFKSLEANMLTLGRDLNNIPAIQPVNNSDLTKLAASYGMRIHPFYRTMASHQGVDYAVPEQTRVYATADGVVDDISNSAYGKGLCVTINHGNGYRTLYGHLDKAVVKKGARVRRGDIIGHSGNTGLSFMPHLHYEVVYNGRRVDPINYFFYEMTPESYLKLLDIAQIGMQSLD